MGIKSKKDSMRAPLTTEELERLSADDFVRLKLTGDEKTRLQEINRVRLQVRAARSARLREEEGPILTDLRRIGVEVESIWNLVNTSSRYPKAIPVLLKHLLLPYSDRTREGIARSLAVSEPAVQKAWPKLVDEFRRAPMGWGFIAPHDVKEYRLGSKDGLACALSAAVTDETLPELIDLVKDRANGESRILLLSALKTRMSTNTFVKQVIDELASDPELAREIGSWRK